MISDYAKIGNRLVDDLFDGNVVIEEKVDGSQFSFGVFNGKLECKSRNQQLDLDNAGMFQPGVNALREIAHTLATGWTYRGEYLSKPKHNVLTYNRHPSRHVMIWDIESQYNFLSPKAKREHCETLGLECVPCFFNGETTRENVLSYLPNWLDSVSALGGARIEGVVLKNYAKYDRYGKLLTAKLVSAEFKEQHVKKIKVGQPSNIIEDIAAQLKTEARWRKAVQHLKERNELSGDAKDIGPLIQEVQRDTFEEAREEIQTQLFEWASKGIGKRITAGFSDWYKAELAKGDQ